MEIAFWTKTQGWYKIADVYGSEAIGEAYGKACELAEIIGATCALIDLETGEILDMVEY